MDPLMAIHSLLEENTEGTDDLLKVPVHIEIPEASNSPVPSDPSTEATVR
jgi:hypothetical protein